MDKPAPQYPGHQASPSGVTLREGLSLRETGSLEDGLCYLITLYLKGAVNEEETRTLSSEKKALTAQLSEAGIKGARSLRSSLSQRIESLYLNVMETFLREEKGAGDLLPHTGDWNRILKETPDCRVVDSVVTRNHLHILIRWAGTISLEQQIASWKEQMGHVCWDDDFYTLLVPENRLGDFLAFLEKDKTVAGPEFQIETRHAEAAAQVEARPFHHITVLRDEAAGILKPGPGKLIVDATLGGGGHAELLLERGASVIGIDQDPEARNAACARLARFGDRFQVIEGNFRQTRELLQEKGIGPVDGLLADIGVSSHQLDSPERGFSFRSNGPLDMRMGPGINTTAADLVNNASEEELARIFREYGEERAARSMARIILRSRERGPITTTAELAALAEKAIPRRSGHHPGTKIFQALRIAANDELGALQALLETSADILAPGGILAVITFHSLEDRCVKHFLEAHSKREIDRPEWPEPRPNPNYHYDLLLKKPLTAGNDELKLNPRARSAKLRAAQRTTHQL